MGELHMMQLFDSLPPASPEQLIGRAWRGRVIRTGRFLDLPDMFMIQPARLLGFKWGKRYLTPYIGDPLCYTFFDRVHIPQPLWGNVGMHSISFVVVPVRRWHTTTHRGTTTSLCSTMGLNLVFCSCWVFGVTAKSVEGGSLSLSCQTSMWLDVICGFFCCNCPRGMQLK